MEITDVRIKLMPESGSALRAFCTITLDGEFVVLDIKLLERKRGLFVAMPDRKLADRCPHCNVKNHLRARYCQDCGRRLDEGRATRDGAANLFANVVHPITSNCRQKIEAAILAAYADELERSRLPGYEPRYFWEGGDEAADLAVTWVA